MKHCPHCKKYLGSPRSLLDHRRLFGLIRAAFYHWPHAHEFQPDNEEHLRAWLLCKSGYRETHTIAVNTTDDPQIVKVIALAVTSAIRAAGGYAFVRPDEGCIRVFSAKSIKFDTLDQMKFVAVRLAVEDVLKAELAIDLDTLLKETEHAA